MADVTELFRRLDHISRRSRYPATAELKETLTGVLDTYGSEDPAIRPRDDQGRPGGFLSLPAVPAVIVPDLHARVDYLHSLARWTPPGQEGTVLDLLAAGELQVICVGDGFHAERRALDRWKEAMGEFYALYKHHRAMDAEMNESLSVMQIVMEWKTAFPDRFHFLKGNHENVANEESADNRPFRKFAWEGEMVAFWFKKFLGEEVFSLWYDFEKRLPVFAAGDRFCVCHAEPRTHYTRRELINCSSRREIVFDLTWTDDNAAEPDSVEAYLEEYFPGCAESRIFGGHRPVRERYNLRAGGRYIQIHNPSRKIAALVRDIGTFSPEDDIIELE